MQITIDTHKFVKFLSEKKHFTQEQAEVLIEAATEYHNLYTNEIVTKDNLKQEIALLKKDLKLETESIKQDLKLETESIRKDMESLELRLTIKLGAIMFALLLAFKILDKFI